MQKKANFFVIAITIFGLLILAGVIAFIAYFTNNFSTDMTTFYVQYGATEYRRDTGGLKLECGIVYRFECKYPLGFPSNEKGERYTVGVEVTNAAKEIEYKVDGLSKTLYSISPTDLTSFEIVRYENGFEFCIPEDITLQSILEEAYKDKEITEIKDVDFAAKDYFSLVVKSYDGETVIRIDFHFEIPEKALDTPSEA